METHTECCPDVEAYWYYQDIYYNVSQGGLNCCSDKVIQFHYINPHELHNLDYFIYRVYPYGVDADTALDILPRKLTMDEIIAASNYKSPRRERKEKGIAK